mmetsp:Transcript_5555/g.13899  ORF Transcript_5555/g.13899 Transcript_5555/m.13899 type:complete len:337 (+) Transcript_5555:139-1149(+)
MASSTAPSDLNSYAGTLDLTDYVERANAATGNQQRQRQHHPESSRQYGWDRRHKFAIVGCILGFSLVLIAVAMSASSMQKSNEALELAMANTEAIESETIKNEKLIYINGIGSSNVAEKETGAESGGDDGLPSENGEESSNEEELGGGALPSDQAPKLTTPSPTSGPTSVPTAKPATPPPTTEKPTEPHPLDPRWFQTTHADYVETAANNAEHGHHSYFVAQLFCMRQDRAMCGYDAYCPNGPGLNAFGGGPPKLHNWKELEEAQWAPFREEGEGVDVMTHWVQVGLVPAGEKGGSDENGFVECWKYDDWTASSGEDIESFSEEKHRMWILCCERS